MGAGRGAEPGRDRGRGAGCSARRVGAGRSPSGCRSSTASVGGTAGEASRMTQARCPSPLGACRSACSRRKLSTAAGATRRPLRSAHDEGLLDAGSASPMSDPIRASAVARSSASRSRTGGPLQCVRHRRQRRADQPPLHDRARVDELLELRPAEWLGEDAAARTPRRARPPRSSRPPVPRCGASAARSARARRAGRASRHGRRTAAPRARRLGDEAPASHSAVDVDASGAQVGPDGRLDRLDERPADAEDTSRRPGATRSLGRRVVRVGRAPRGPSAGA